MLSFLFAMDKNRVIGKDNDLPWHLPDDLKFFKEKTLGHTIIMGRKTFESLGKALPKRKNIVLTSDRRFEAEGAFIIHDIEEIVKWNKENPEEEWFVIGGSGLFSQLLEHADRMYMTYIDASFPGDTYFPEFSEEEWKLTNQTKGPKNDRNPYDYYYRTYDRV
ncbi:dihydrofolate reductase [Thalassobacillus hwangdonensis]|uniref:Dihydrofolate reductase n=1 Tax=Thalassobacillus hwangdonensis TaxID=546108 RepID=A0ABW3KXY5_9BACI